MESLKPSCHYTEGTSEMGVYPQSVQGSGLGIGSLRLRDFRFRRLGSIEELYGNGPCSSFWQGTCQTAFHGHCKKLEELLRDDPRFKKPYTPNPKEAPC